MKKVFGLVAAVAMMFGGVAFAEGYLCANDLEKNSAVTAPVDCEDGFKIICDEDKAIAIDEMGVGVDSTDGDTFTKRLNMKGAGSVKARAVSFPAKKGETIIVYGNSSSKEEKRPIFVFNPALDEDEQIVGKVNANAYSPDGVPVKVSVLKVKAPADGTYYAYSGYKGVYIYQIKVTK